MSRAPVRTPARARPHCAENDCQRTAAEATTRLADHMDHLFGVPGAPEDEQGEAMRALKTIGQIAGMWLRACAFVRKWFPRVGWWLVPIAGTLLTKGSSEAADQLIAALTAFLQSQTGAGQ